MREVTVISGKGGTGKTSVLAAFASLAGNGVFADCDVDAADLALLLKPTRSRRPRETFRAGYEPVLDPERCTGCGDCIEVCRFDAIAAVPDASGSTPRFDLYACEGCGCCSDACPVEAIPLREKVAGELFVSETRFGPMVHARLGIAQATSGKLVTMVRQRAREIAEQESRDWLLIDGAPGIGCPVIASLAGVEEAVIVTEPTVAGRHDLERVLTLCEHFKLRAGVVVNKFDLNPAVTTEIEEAAAGRGAAVLGRIPFDPAVVKATVAGKTAIEGGNGPGSASLREIWRRLEQRDRGEGTKKGA